MEVERGASLRPGHNVLSHRISTSLVIVPVFKFCEDLETCKDGCWAFSVFAGEGGAVTYGFRFQAAALEADVMVEIATAVDVHQASAPLSR